MDNVHDTNIMQGTNTDIGVDTIKGKLDVSHGCHVEWQYIPKGFDWLIVCALRLIAINQYPLTRQLGSGMLIPKEQDEFEVGVQMLELDVTPMGVQLKRLCDAGQLPENYHQGIVTPMLVYTRPDGDFDQVTDSNDFMVRTIMS